MIREYSFLIIALGTILLSISAGMVGCLNVYKGQSLIGDAAGHASFPGVVLVFMLFQSRNPSILLSGAVFTAALAYIFVQITHKNSRIGLDASLAIFLSGFFGLGMVLKSIIQGNPSFQNASQAGIDSYIFGQASFMLESDIIAILIVSLSCIALFLLFYKELKLYIFDPEFARASGVRTRLIDAVLLLLTISLVAVGLKAVGSILISSLLIIPCISAGHWSRRFSHVLLLSAGFGAVSAFIGTYMSTAQKGFSTGPSIILTASIFAFASMLFGTNGGIITKRLWRTKNV